jgi:hypothetical protein
MAAVPLNEARAAKALAFFNRLRLPDIAGNPPLADACGDWFRDILVRVPGERRSGDQAAARVGAALHGAEEEFEDDLCRGARPDRAVHGGAPNRQMLIVAPSQNISERCFARRRA